MSHGTGDKESAGSAAQGGRRRGDQIKFFMISDVAASLDVATRTVRRWIKSGDLVAHRFGGVVRIAEVDLRGFLAAHRE